MADFNHEIDNIETRSKQIIDDAKSLNKRLATARKNTAQLLKIAQDNGVTAVSVGKRHERVNNEDWSFGFSGNIFTPDGEDINGWSAAWHLAENMGISHGAGNSGQHQADTSELVDGVYELRNGNWARIDLLEV